MKRNQSQSIIIILLSAAFFLLFINAALAATFCAGNASELQSAITNAAGNGQDDTIQVVQGTYDGNFLYSSSEANSLSVKGGYAAGCGSRTINPANTVLDGTNTDSPLILVSSEAADFLVEGLTLQNGNSAIEKGGGLYALTRGSVTMKNSILSNNTAGDSGGGAYVDAASLTLEDSTISQNSGGGGSGTPYGVGAGLFVTSADAITLTRSTITDNTAVQSHGGGIFVDLYSGSNRTVQLTDNTVSGNSTPYAGGGLMAYGDTIVLTSNRFNNNSAGDGAGMWIDADDLTAVGNTFSHNYAANNGARIANNIIHNKTAANWDGGGVDLTNVWTANLANNTIADNTCGNDGGGVKLWLSDDPETAHFYNNIVMSNSASRGNDLFINNDYDNNLILSTVELFNNDFDRSAAGFYIQRPISIDPSNLDNADPLFRNQTIGDYRLRRPSPCIDSGTSVGAPDTDIVGNPRPQGEGFDIGAYEYAGSGCIGPALNLLIGD